MVQKLSECVLLLFWIFLPVDCRDSGLVSGSRTLQQGPDLTRTRLRLVNFSKVEDSNATTLNVGEFEIPGLISVTEQQSNVQDGAYYLGPQQVSEINETISKSQNQIPASEATIRLNISYPGVVYKGKSILDNLSDRQLLRIPTVFAPFYSNTVFDLESRPERPGTDMFVSNMSLVVTNASYQGISKSGLKDFIKFGDKARLCFTNSMLILKSCKGFPVNDIQMWCCTASTCDLVYTEEAIADLGLKTEDGLQPLTCHSLDSEEEAEISNPEQKKKKKKLNPAATAAVATSIAVAVLLAVALALVWRHRRAQQTQQIKADEMQMQIGKYMQQLEKHRERSRNEQAELQKVKMQYKMLEMDLLANTASGKTNSGAHGDSPGDNEGAKARAEKVAGDGPPQTLTVLDAGERDTDVSAKTVQKQLRAVLNAADERTPVSVQAEIGRGAFGVVYLGIWKNIQVAIKTVLFQATGDIKSDPVLREAMLALRIAHPNLVATYRANVRTLEDNASGPSNQFHITGDITPSYQLFLLQEYCDSGTLYDWLSRERMHPGNVPDQAVIVRCALDIARGIQHLHHSDIVHGDLKPQNIMLTTIPEAVRAASETPSPPSFPYITKLTDFGLSFQMDRNKSHMSNMRIGTPFYFAPEVQGKGYLSKAADTYSLGVLLWEMFHGMPPYAAENGHLVNNTSFPRFDLRHREDAPFSYVVVALACLSEDFEKRPSIDNVVLVLEDLNECLSGSPDSSQVMRNAGLNRVTKGSYKAGFAAPASLVKQANAAKAQPSGSRSTRKKESNVAAVILKMLSHSGLHRDSDLRKRLDVTDSAELEKLAGVPARSAHTRTPQRCLRDVRGEQGASSVHVGSRWLFDVLPPTSVEGGTAGRPGS